MESNKEQMHATNVPRLRVFWGDGDTGADDHRPPKPSRQALREWTQREAFWAGRNRAGRFSARLAA